MSVAPSTKRKLTSISISALVLFGAAAIVIEPELNAAPPPDSVGDGFRIEHRGPAPSWWLSSTRDSRCWDPKPAERGFTRATNLYRKRLGRGTLRLDAELSAAARKHTREMTSRDYLHHTSSDALRRRVTFWTLLGENVGVGNTVDSLQAAFIDSPAHRDNIVYPTFKHIGVGTKSAHGRLWVTILFEARENPGTTLRMPRCN
jgi:Arc/MetJ family transcription regulator